MRHTAGEWIYTIWDAVVTTASNKEEVEAAFANNLFELYLDSAMAAQQNAKDYFRILLHIIVRLAKVDAWVVVATAGALKSGVV